MNRTPVSAPATLPREDRLHLMRQKSIKQLPLVDEGGHLIVVETLDELLEPRHYPNPVLIMAGGLGERLGALTREVPKPMLNVGGRPLLETIVRNVVQQGFGNIFISVNYKAAASIKDYFGDGAAFGANIRYVARNGAPGDCRRARTSSATLPDSADDRHQRRHPHHDQLRRRSSTSTTEQPAEATMAVREHKVHVPVWRGFHVGRVSPGHPREADRELVRQCRHLCDRPAPCSAMSRPASGSTCRPCWSA